MKALVILSIAVLGCVFASKTARAADACKECIAFHKACVQNHSKEACKVD